MKKTVFFSVLIIFSFLAGHSSLFAQGLDHSNFKDTEQCINCHSKEDLTTKKDGKTISLYFNKERFEKSRHGNMPCISCHDFTDDNEGNDNSSENCGNCHTGAANNYELSIHGETESGPNCADCHGYHEITSVDNNTSPVNPRNQHESCGDCHKNAANQYTESFHGKAVALGSEESPSCSHCHGAHKILSSDKPVSNTNEERAPALCAQCHEGNTLGVNAVEHYTLEPSGYGAPMYWIKKIFMWLILIVVGFFLIHILLDLSHKLRTRKS
ncbi:MAG: hypothetical protein AAGU27_19315 [Dehalobacterium sp.]